ncbi:response regulator [Methanoplanus sp. FWC-SCC4]|uniref:Response regulator n=1 Tax=Methanochimaera problematica TaxID=2609417 RepID=A0AA97FAT5_9EURY|nr:response regulator [Methanoplanus sp. FWC-SCC4]WOF15564.1 response regulator [Methanoplanus sp. FWC-SCC4]
MIRVLMIDDEQVVLDVTKMYLEHFGHISVDCVLSANLGIEKLMSEHYDAIICDYDMDEIDGISFLKAIRGIYPGVNLPCPDIPFIIFTGKGDECVVIEALNSGADYYLQKGNDPKGQLLELCHKIEDIVQRRCTEEIVSAAFENTGTCMVLVDKKGIIVRANNQMGKIYDCQVESINGLKHWESFVFKEDHGKIHEFLEKICESAKRTKSDCEFKFVSNNDSVYPARMNASYIPGKKICVMSIDVSD